MDLIIFFIGLILIFVLFPLTIIITIVKLVKKKNAKVWGIAIPVSLSVGVFLIIVSLFIPSSDNLKDTENNTVSINDSSVENAKIDNISNELSSENILKDDKESQIENVKETENDKAIKEVETENTNPFIDSLSRHIEINYAENVYDIYVNELGFETVEFKEKLGETGNYSITANGYHTVATVMDDYVRIFAPNTDYVFYEDGEVLMTYEDFKDGQIEISEMPYYYSIAQIIVEGCLKSPTSADFPNSDKISYQKKDNLVAIKGYVDADNSFGAKIRSEYIVQFYVTDLQNLLYEPTYIEIDGEKTGTFIEF